MEQIKTAEEFIKENTPQHHLGDLKIPCYYPPAIQKMMIEFAKLHVEAALKAAYTNSKIIGTWGKEDWEGINIATRDEYGGWIDVEISEKSILNSYPLDNIK